MRDKPAAVTRASAGGGMTDLLQFYILQSAPGWRGAQAFNQLKRREFITLLGGRGREAAARITALTIFLCVIPRHWNRVHRSRRR